MHHHIRQKLGDIFRDHFLIRFNRLSNHLKLDEDLGLNPLEKLEMLFYIENEFNIQIEDKEIPQLQTVRDLVCYVEKSRK